MGVFSGNNKNKVFKRSTQSVKNPFDVNKTNQNYLRRLKAAGIDVDKATDNRNAVEKFFNVKKDQNALFDIFEVLGRPQQAAFGAIKAAQEGKDVGKAAWKGLKGDKETQFKEILMNTGKFKDRKGKIDVADVLGFAGDVVLDPADLIPVAGFNKVGKALDAGEGLYKSLKQADTVSDLAMKSLGKVAKTGVKAIDKGVETGLKISDKLSDSKIAKIAKKEGKSVDAIKDALNITNNSLDNYRNAKQAIGGLFRPDKGLEGLVDASKRAKGDSLMAENIAKTMVEDSKKETRALAETFAKETGQNVDDIEKQMHNAATYLIQDSQDTALKGSNIWNSLGRKGQKNIIKGLDKESIDVLEKALKDNGIKYTRDAAKNTIKIDATNEFINTLKSNREFLDKLDDLPLRKDLGYDDIARQALEDSKKFINSDKRLQDWYSNIANNEEMKGLYGNVGKAFDEFTGTNMSNISGTKGYIRGTATQEAIDTKKATGQSVSNARGTKSFGSKQYPTVLGADAAQRAEDAQRQVKIDRLNKSIENNQNKTFKGVVEDLESKIADKKESISIKRKEADDAIANLKKSRTQIGKRIAKNENAIKGETNKVLKDLDTYNKNIEKARQTGAKSAKSNLDIEKNAAKEQLIRQSATDFIDKTNSEIAELSNQLGGLKGAGEEAFNARNEEKLNTLIKQRDILESKQGIQKLNHDFYDTIIDHINNAQELTAGAKTYNEALGRSIFTNSDYVVDAATAGKQPMGMVKVHGTDIAKKMNAYKGILPEGANEFAKLAKEFQGKELYMNKQLANILDVANKSSDGAKGLLNILDGINNTFKKFSIMSPGFQMRNVFGNATNMYLSGVPAKDIPIYYAKAAESMNKASDVYEKIGKYGLEALDDGEKTTLNLIKQFYEGGFDNAGTRLQDLQNLRESIKKTGPLNKVSEVNMKLNEGMDKLNRYALLMYANDNPRYLEKLGVKDSIEAVKYALMDPDNLTDFEKNVMKRIVPFYTFTKQNLLYHTTNITKNAPKYNRLVKSINSMYDSLDEDSYNQYQKENFQIPLPFKDSEGNQLFLKSNLPLSDLGEYMSNPLGRTLSATNPLIKGTIEKVTGKDLFTGYDKKTDTFSSFASDRGMNTDEGAGKVAKKYMDKAENLLTTMGMSNITTNMVKKVGAIIKKHNGDISNNELWAEIGRSMLQNSNQETIANNKAWDDMETYQALVKQLKNQGMDIPTIKELDNANKVSLRKVTRRRNKVFK